MSIQQLRQAINVYKLLILRKSERLLHLSFTEHCIDSFDELFNEIQQLKQEIDKLESELYERQCYKFAQ